MGRNSLVIFIVIIFVSCNGNANDINKLLSEQKSTFALASTIDNLLDFFPNEINESNAFFEASPPACPPQYKCAVQFGDIYLNVSKKYNSKLYNQLVNKNVKYKARYFDSNIIINLYELKDTIFNTQKCNMFFKDKYPIPHFEDHNFGLGCKTESKTIDKERYYNYTYSVPSDLLVFVIDSESGNFWKSRCNEKRPISLKNWAHGYSKGFAISEEENMIVFWAIIW